MNILTPRADSHLADIQGSDQNAASVQKTLVCKSSKRIHLLDNLCQQILEFFYRNQSYEAYNRIKMIDDVERNIEMWLACKVGKGSFHMVRAADMARSNQMRIASYILFQADDEEEIGENSDQES